MAYLFNKKTHFLTGGQTNGQTHEQMNGQSDFIMPQILFGGIKSYRQKAFDKLI